VAEEIERRPTEVLRLSVQALSREVGVSEATVVRCARSIGYAGLKELKLALAADAYAPDVLVSEPLHGDDTLRDVVRKVLTADIRAIEDTLSILDHEAMGQAVDALAHASRIDCYGAGSSISIAMDASYRFSRLGLQATVATNPHMQVASAMNLPAGAVAFAVSHTGRATDTFRAFQTARDAGATCVLLTSFANTPIGKLADVQLVTAPPQTEYRVEAVATRIAHLSVIDALSVAVGLQRPDATRSALLRDEEFNAELEIRH
jgi:DNA-binding MurR/RpiR family transcriptional regulator